MTSEVGLVGSPSTTAKVTVDIIEDATDAPLRGQVVSLVHRLSDSYLIAIGTVTEIETSNRWHEDSNMRGVLKTHGSLPHLSEVGDVRTADVAIQAVYEAQHENPSEGDPPTESAAALGMSPTTGARVRRVTNDFLKQLLRKHSEETISLGTIYGMDGVRLPMIVRHFGPEEEGGAGESYHTGIFGMTGSGKSGFATYLLAAYARQTSLAILLIDPQGQFASEQGLPFSLQDWMGAQGREVLVLSVGDNLGLTQDASLLIDLLKETRFFRNILSIGAEENRGAAAEEMLRLLRNEKGWPNKEPSEVLRRILKALVDDDQAMRRIYSSDSSRNRLGVQIQTILELNDEFVQVLSVFGPLVKLFSNQDRHGKQRASMSQLISNVFGKRFGHRPFIILDVSGEAGANSDEIRGPLEDPSIKARLLVQFLSMFESEAVKKFNEGGGLNTMVVLDEAQRFAPESTDNHQIEELARRLVNYVRETRKYGLGWAFITQEINALRRGIFSQLRVRAYGYGLTSGRESGRLREEIDDRDALQIYRSFVDPQSVHPSRYPFMITGPISPLSFTGAPLFLSVYTNFDEFRSDNGFDEKA